MMNTLVFIHGLESTSQGTKGQYFSKHFPAMIIEDYPGNFEERMNKLNTILSGRQNLILVGSSYGGLMAAVFAAKNEKLVKKMVLLAPALMLPEFIPVAEKQLPMPVVIYHGRADIIVDPYLVKEIAAKAYPLLEHHLFEDDHSLSATFPGLDWEKILQTDYAL